jgi:integrase
MAVRYQHITDKVRTDVAKQVDGLIWKKPKKEKKKGKGKRRKKDGERRDQGDDGPAGDRVAA